MTDSPQREPGWIPSDSIHLRLYVEDMAAREDITGCPVSWCDEAGKHWWPHEVDGSRSTRIHSHEVWARRDIHEHGAVVSVEVLESEDPFNDDRVAVDVFADDMRFHNVDEIREFIAALTLASGIAFP